MEERISNELRELALINKKRQFRNPQSGRSNRYTKEQKLAIVEAHVIEHLPINELSQEFGSLWMGLCEINRIK